MIRNLLATTAIATLVATGAFAQTTPAAPDPAAPGAMTAPEAPMVIRAEGHLASNIIGETVYSGAGDDAENIGRVNDLVLDADGSIRAVVIGVGGFLGIGQRDVAIDYEMVRWEERDNERFLVVETTREALEGLEEFDAAAYRPMPADADVREPRPATAEDLAAAPAQDDLVEGEPADDMAAAPADDDAVVVEQDTAAAPADEPVTDDMAAAPADDDAVVTDDQDIAQAPAEERVETDQLQTGAIDRTTLQERPIDQIRAEDFIGTTVYGANEENLGSVGDIVLSADGQVDAILVDVGGFLGIGAKEVALGMDNLQFMSDADGNLYLYTNLTREQLDAQPAYDEAGYTEHRDQMRMDVPAMR